MHKRVVILGLICLLFLSSCNLSVSEMDNSTINNLNTLLTMPAPTAISTQPSLTTQITIPTTVTTLLPTNTPNPTPAAIDPAYKDQPCDVATFVADVTIEDYSEIKAGESFLKTWRIKNEGSCVWTPNYKIVFNHGDQMNAPIESAFLTSDIYPGQTADISITFTAPFTEGYYESHFLLKNPSGIEFGVSNLTIYLLIEVVAELTQPISNTITGNTLSIPVAETKTVFGDNIVSSAFNFGDLSSDKGAIAFARFNLNTIPTGTNILMAELLIGNHSMSGSPFQELGCMRAYAGSYFPADMTDYIYTEAGEIMTVCDQESLTTPIEFDPQIIQNAIAIGEIQLKMMFNERENNLNGMGDLIRINPGTITLRITY